MPGIVYIIFFLICQVLWILRIPWIFLWWIFLVGPIRRRITDKAPMSLPSGRRDDQIYLKSQKRDLSSYRACYHHDTGWEKKNRSRFFKVMLEAWDVPPSKVCSTSDNLSLCTSNSPRLNFVRIPPLLLLTIFAENCLLSLLLLLAGEREQQFVWTLLHPRAED